MKKNVLTTWRNQREVTTWSPRSKKLSWMPRPIKDEWPDLSPTGSVWDGNGWIPGWQSLLALPMRFIRLKLLALRP